MFIFTSTISSRCRYIPRTSHLVIKVCFGPSLWPQTQLAIGHLPIVVPETSDSRSQYQQSSHDCHGNQGDDGPVGALGNLDDLRETPCVCPLRRGEKKPGCELASSDLATGAEKGHQLCLSSATVPDLTTGPSGRSVVGYRRV